MSSPWGECLRCKKPLGKNERTRRGLDNACYCAARVKGELYRYPRKVRVRSQMNSEVETYVKLMRSTDLTPAQAAKQLGVHPDTMRSRLWKMGLDSRGYLLPPRELGESPYDW